MPKPDVTPRSREVCAEAPNPFRGHRVSGRGGVACDEDAMQASAPALASCRLAATTQVPPQDGTIYGVTRGDGVQSKGTLFQLAVKAP